VNKKWIPPAVVDAVRTMRNRRVRIFPTYADAQAACSFAGGYQNPELARTVLKKTLLARELNLTEVMNRNVIPVALLAVSLAASRKSRPVRVLDFGGGMGVTYFLAQQALGRFCCRWAIVETSAMVDAAGQLETDELRFFTSSDQAVNWLESVDLLHSFSALPYVSDPAQSLRDLLSHKPEIMLWGRLYLSTAESLVTIQRSDLSSNGPLAQAGSASSVVEYPRTFFSEREFLNITLSDYRLIFRLPEGLPPMKVRGREILPDVHYLFKRSR